MTTNINVELENEELHLPTRELKVMAIVFALGSNGSGQLGIGHKEDVSVPKPALFRDHVPSSITAIAAGGNHTLLLAGSGEVYWSGDPTSGSCSLVSDQTKPSDPSFCKMILDKDVQAEHGSPVRMMAATWEASVFTRLDGQGKNTKVYSCGLGEKGELGHGQVVVRLPLATEIPDFPPAGTEVVDLTACMRHVVAVLSNGDAYGWGNGRKGQIGAPEEVVFSPRKIEGIGFKVERAVCGKDFTCFLGEPKNGETIILGSDKWGIKSSTPSAVPGWKDVGASWSNIFVLKSDGGLLSWGRNDYSQNAPKDIPKALRMAVGSEHVVALLETRDVFAWGWGEHGNCGPLSSNNDKGQRNIIASSKYIPPGSQIATIGAGCATSWIIIEETSQSAS